VGEIDRRIGMERAEKSFLRRLIDLSRRRDLSWKEKWRHHWAIRHRNRALDTLRRIDDSCLMPWYALVARANGDVPVCCVLQGKVLGSLRQRSLKDIWHGEAFEGARRQLHRILEEGEAWHHDPGSDTAIESMCAPKREAFCFMRNFFYCLDIPFLHRLHTAVAGVRNA
jgi:MoaA/NifB/PqqE/SkfB family radical SAM enzyme